MDREKILAGLNVAFQMEMTGIVRYLHQSFRVFGPESPEIVRLLREQANESMEHAIKVGEKITAMGGTPSVEIREILEPDEDQTTEEMLAEDMEVEVEARDYYQSLLPLVADDVVLDDFVRGFVVEESSHIEFWEKLLRRPRRHRGRTDKA